MQGLFKRKGSDIWQGRFRIPSDLWRERKLLAELGVKDIPKAQEHGRSTGMEDRDAAGETYRALLVAWDARMAGWRQVLEGGPANFDIMEAVKVAAIGAARRWEAFKDNPLDAPVAPREGFPRPPLTVTDETRKAIEKMQPEEREAARAAGAANVARLLEGSRLERLQALQAVRDGRDYPWCFPEFRAVGLAMMEMTQGDAITEDLRAAGISAADGWSRFLVGLEGLGARGRLRESLEARADGDLGEPRWVEDARRQEVGIAPPRGSDKRDARFTFKAIVDAETARRALGKDAKPFPDSTVRKYSKRGEEFTAWRKAQGLGKAAASDARTVTREEAERWRASMLDKGDIGNRTINDKLACLSTIIKWGRRLYREDFHPAGNPLAGLEKLDFTVLDSDARTYRLGVSPEGGGERDGVPGDVTKPPLATAPRLVAEGLKGLVEVLEEGPVAEALGDAEEGRPHACLRVLPIRVEAHGFHEVGHHRERHGDRIEAAKRQVSSGAVLPRYDEGVGLPSGSPEFGLELRVLRAAPGNLAVEGQRCGEAHEGGPKRHLPYGVGLRLSPLCASDSLPKVGLEKVEAGGHLPAVAHDVDGRLHEGQNEGEDGMPVAGLLDGRPCRARKKFALEGGGLRLLERLLVAGLPGGGVNRLLHLSRDIPPEVLPGEAPCVGLGGGLSLHIGPIAEGLEELIGCAECPRG